jgi:hypothetical protein
MRVDIRVSRRKFEQEVAKLSAQTTFLSDRWIFIKRAEYPFVDLLFVPHRPLRLVQLLPFSEGVVLPEGTPKPAAMEFHLDLPFTTRPFGVRVGLDDFDLRPPSVIFCDPVTWQELPPNLLHRGNHVDSNGVLSPVVLDSHPVFQRPFLCMRGIREYHEHPQHTGDDWMLYRMSCSLFSTIDTVWTACVRNAHPIFFFNPQVNPPVGAAWGLVKEVVK